MTRPSLYIALLSLSLATLLGAARPKPWQTFTGTVTSVHDGDTVTLLAKSANGKEQEYKVRLLYIDAPEIAQPHGIESRDWLREQVLGKEVKVRWQTQDRYGRIVGEVGTVNLAEVKSGHAWFYDAYPPRDADERAAFVDAQKDAKADKAGLWAEKAQPPWEYRRAKKGLKK